MSIGSRYLTDGPNSIGGQHHGARDGVFRRHRTGRQNVRAMPDARLSARARAPQVRS
jgi:hypothetical protein